jgi:preprotein translocase subunit YajC
MLRVQANGAIEGLPPRGNENIAPGGNNELRTEIGHNGGNGNEYLPPPEGGGMATWMMLLVWGAVFAGMWFLMIRPQRKREKQMKELQAAITTGDNIITSGGIFGKVADVGEDCFIVEFGTNKGIRIPVLKADVVAIREPKMTPQPKD